ncbi:MAG TPA: hypothetical protein VJ829_12335, partial [Candidatus Binatia bacterium]|nr:hypothetical protein [Candidatus Binatia bacterium]
MKLDLTALVTACFAVAVSMPPVGLVVHRHAGGELPHVHAGPDGDAPHDAPDLDDDDHEYAGDHDPAPGLHVAPTGHEWHTHATFPDNSCVRTEIQTSNPKAPCFAKPGKNPVQPPDGI